MQKRSRNMKQIIVAFDVDGTILNNEGATSDNGINLPVVQLMEVLKRKMKNTRIIVWSGGGKDYAEHIVEKYGLGKYVDDCYGKTMYEEELDGKVDIAFDDQHAFSMAEKNIIVRMK